MCLDMLYENFINVCKNPFIKKCSPSCHKIALNFLSPTYCFYRWYNLITMYAIILITVLIKLFRNSE